jgi:hypothetical protein
MQHHPKSITAAFAVTTNKIMAVPVWCSIILLCSTLLFTGCSHSGQEMQQAQSDTARQVRLRKANAAIDSATLLVKQGDLLVRTGNDFTSESLRLLNRRNHTYSHCGIASIEEGQVYVYHSIGGEFNPDQKIKRDSLQHFAESVANTGIGIYRYTLPAATIAQVVAAAKQMYRAGIMFDMQFDLATNERMYCAEYVYKSLLIGSNGRLDCGTSHINDFEFVGVDDLFLHPLCQKIKAIVY